MSLLACAFAAQEACLSVRRDCSGFIDFVLMAPVYLIKLVPAGLIMKAYHLDSAAYYDRFVRTDQTFVVAIVSLLYFLAALLVARLVARVRRGKQSGD
jgi:hypothetical protein